MLGGPFHTGIFSLHCELRGGGGVAFLIPRCCHDHPKTELCFQLPLGSLAWALAGAGGFEEEVCGFESWIWLSLDLKTFYFKFKILTLNNQPFRLVSLNKWKEQIVKANLKEDEDPAH